MIRQTSVNAYNFIKSSGVLGELQWQTYDVLFRRGGLTANEIFVTVKKEMLAAGVAESVVNELRDTYHQRLSELKDMGLVYEVQERKCTVTLREVIEWDVTSNMPVQPVKVTAVTAGVPHQTRAQIAKINDDFLHKAVNELVLVDSITGAGKPLENMQQYDLRVLIDQIHHHLGIKSNISGNYPQNG